MFPSINHYTPNYPYLESHIMIKTLVPYGNYYRMPKARVTKDARDKNKDKPSWPLGPQNIFWRNKFPIP